VVSPDGRRRALAARLNAGIAVTFFVAVVINLARAVSGDAGTWAVEQPWLGVRVVVGVLFVLLVLARAALGVASRLAAARERRAAR
jgi:hypothetical protein